MILRPIHRLQTLVLSTLPATNVSLIMGRQVPSKPSLYISTGLTTVDISSPHISSDDVFARRGSTSSHSPSHTTPHMSQYLATHRASLSSFASSSFGPGGSPRAPPSSNGTTVGDLSTASMPLLPGVRGRDDESLRFSPWSQTPVFGAVIGKGNSNGSDTSSVHSYPPKPRSSGSLEGAETWRSGRTRSSVRFTPRLNREVVADEEYEETGRRFYQSISTSTYSPSNDIHEPFRPHPQAPHSNRRLRQANRRRSPATGRTRRCA